MSLIPVLALADNDRWLLHDDRHALALNPGDARAMMAAHPIHKPDLKSILVTRHRAGSRMQIPSNKRAALFDGNAASCTHAAISPDLRRPFTCESDNRCMANVPPHYFLGPRRPHRTERMNRNRPIKNQLK